MDFLTMLADESKGYNPRQPRDDLGRWSDGATGGISVGHALHVLRHEGIHDQHHHDAVREAIQSGKHTTREQVLAHIDSIHEGKKAPQMPPKPAISYLDKLSEPRSAPPASTRQIDFLRELQEQHNNVVNKPVGGVIPDFGWRGLAKAVKEVIPEYIDDQHGEEGKQNWEFKRRLRSALLSHYLGETLPESRLVNLDKQTASALIDLHNKNVGEPIYDALDFHGFERNESPRRFDGKKQGGFDLNHPKNKDLKQLVQSVAFAHYRPNATKSFAMDLASLTFEEAVKAAAGRGWQSQPRDDEGKWTIIAGSPRRITNKPVTAQQVREEAEKHKVSPRGVELLLEAHKKGVVTNDNHLLRAIAHGIHHADGDPSNASHIAAGIRKHGAGGSHVGKFGGWEGYQLSVEPSPKEASSVSTKQRIDNIADRYNITGMARETLHDEIPREKHLEKRVEEVGVIATAAAVADGASKVGLDHVLEALAVVNHPEGFAGYKKRKIAEAEDANNQRVSEGLSPRPDAEVTRLNAIDRHVDTVRRSEVRQTRESVQAQHQANTAYRQAAFGAVQRGLGYARPRKSDEDEDMNDTQVAFGAEIKSLGEEDGKARIGGYLVYFGGPSNTDLVGDWFSPDTYFGSRKGDGADTMIHHGLPLKANMPELDWTRDYLLAPLKTTTDTIGIFAETVCDLANAHEAKIHDLVKAGKLKWSSGAASHTVRRRDGAKAGEITRWPIIEGSLTPTPCQGTGTGVMSLKALVEEGPFDAPNTDYSDLRQELDDLKALVEEHLIPLSQRLMPAPEEVKTDGDNTKSIDWELEMALAQNEMMDSRFITTGLSA